jgi:hypothetical protein
MTPMSFRATEITRPILSTCGCTSVRPVSEARRESSATSHWRLTAMVSIRPRADHDSGAANGVAVVQLLARIDRLPQLQDVSGLKVRGK